MEDLFHSVEHEKLHSKPKAIIIIIIKLILWKQNESLNLIVFVSSTKAFNYMQAYILACRLADLSVFDFVFQNYEVTENMCYQTFF